MADELKTTQTLSFTDGKDIVTPPTLEDTYSPAAMARSIVRQTFPTGGEAFEKGEIVNHGLTTIFNLDAAIALLISFDAGSTYPLELKPETSQKLHPVTGTTAIWGKSASGTVDAQIHQFSY